MAGRPKSSNPRSECLRVMLTAGELGVVRRAAAGAGVSVPAWVRGRLEGVEASPPVGVGTPGAGRPLLLDDPRAPTSPEQRSALARLMASGAVRRGSELEGSPQGGAGPPGGGPDGSQEPAPEAEEDVPVPPRLRQRVVATMRANPEVGEAELVRRFEGLIPGSGRAVRRVWREVEG